MHGRIFAIGGGNGVECFSEVELFDLYIGTWVFSQPMLEKVCNYLVPGFGFYNYEMNYQNVMLFRLMGSPVTTMM